MRTLLLIPPLFLLAVGATAVACGSSSHAGAPDADAGSDAGVIETPDADEPDTNFDANYPDANDVPPPNGTLAAQGFLMGVTAHDWLITSLTDGSIAVTSASNGTTTSIPCSVFPAAVVWSADAVVVPYAYYGPTPLRAWTASGGVHALTQTTVPGVAAISPDQTQVAYATNYGIASDGSYDIKVSNIDGSGGKNVVTGVETAVPAWVGGRLVVASGVYLGDAGTATYTLDAFDPANGFAKTHLASDVASFVFPSEPSAASIVVIGTDGSASAIPVATGTPAAIDANVATATITHDGATVVYATTSGSLKRSPLAAPSPVTLADTGVAITNVTLSPDDSQVAYYSPESGSKMQDAFLASTTTPGTPTALPSSSRPILDYPTFPSMSLAAFSSDSKFVVYQTVFNQNTSTDFVSHMVATSVGDGTSFTIATQSEGAMAFGKGSLAFFNDDYTLTGGQHVVVQNLASPSEVATLATQAYAGPALSGAKDRVFFMWASKDTKDPRNGVYAVPVP